MDEEKYVADNNPEEEIVAGTMENDNGEMETVVMESTNGYNVNLRKNNYKLAEAMKTNKSSFKRGFNQVKNVFGTDIGFRSSGFAQIASLAGIIALAGVIVAFLVLRY